MSKRKQNLNNKSKNKVIKKTKIISKKKLKNTVKSPVLLMILDGFGITKSKAGNAIRLSKMPFYNSLLKNYPNSKLYAAERYVGLPKNQIGNSEVGHMTIGSGRIIDTDLVRINKEIKSKKFFNNKVLIRILEKTKRNRANLHLLGLVSDGGVHSHINHLFALLKLAKQYKIDNVYIHCFLDGRDVPPKSAVKYLKILKVFCKKNKIGKIASIIGRFYAMDRDNRWKREHKAYDLIVNGKGRNFIDDPIDAINYAYSIGETDEFIKPTLIDDSGLVKENDSIIFFNFRSDRARELTKAFTMGSFKGFKRKNKIKINFVCLTMYDRHFKLPVAFPHKVPENTLGEIVSKRNLRQLRIAETEKFPHVTFFFNGGIETPFKKEKRIIIPSPKVLTYDLKPEMSAKKVTNHLLDALDLKKYSLIVLNYANPDMVGHTGSIKATVKALEGLDKQIEKVVTRVLSYNGSILIIADHGNCEKMLQKNGNPYTAHTLNKVPCILVNKKIKSKSKLDKINKSIKIKDGSLKDVAPTLLELLKIKKPKEMTGKSLIYKNLKSKLFAK